MNKVANGINKGGINVGVLTNIAGIFVMSSMLFTIYPQQLSISSGFKSEKQLKVE